jgi:hypothetical protein
MTRRRPQGRRACTGVKAKGDFFREMFELRVVRPGFQEEHGPLWVL